VPELPTSFVTVYAVVAAVNDAEFVVQRELESVAGRSRKVVHSLQEFLLERGAHEVASKSHVRVS
jgi:hypothetical protein